MEMASEWVYRPRVIATTTLDAEDRRLCQKFWVDLDVRT